MKRKFFKIYSGPGYPISPAKITHYLITSKLSYPVAVSIDKSGITVDRTKVRNFLVERNN